MNNTLSNALVLAFCWVLVAGVGTYLTFFHQPRELLTLQETERATVLRQQEADALLAQMSASQTEARDVYQRWNARYKVMPASLRSYEIVDYLNNLTGSGFEAFDVQVVGVTQSAGFSTYSLGITGRAYYGSLYRLVWHLENNRSFYRIRTLELKHLDLRDADAEGRERMQVLVSFNLTLEAYFGGAEGMSAPSAAWNAGLVAAGGSAAAPPPVPDGILPRFTPIGNPFYPIILDAVPPNTYGLVDLDNAQLVSIANGHAVFRDGDAYFTLGVGDAVYLGRITTIDPETSRVVAYLNRGGITDEVEVSLAQPGKGTYKPAVLPVADPTQN